MDSKFIKCRRAVARSIPSSRSDGEALIIKNIDTDPVYVRVEASDISYIKIDPSCVYLRLDDSRKNVFDTMESASLIDGCLFPILSIPIDDITTLEELGTLINMELTAESLKEILKER